MAAESNLDVRVTGRDDLSPTLAQLESRVIRWVGAVSAAMATLKLGAAPITAATEFQRELANVQKTTNFTDAQIKSLSDSLLTLGTRTDVASADLAKIAAAAGQQGLGKFGTEGVLQFTESVARMASVLDVTAEEAGENIGKILNIFKIPLQDVEKAISTFNEVSNNSTAQGKELLDVIRRIGDAAGALDLTQTTALAATGIDFGQSPEVVGTAVANMFANMRQKAQEFGKILNISATDWIDLVEKNGVEALKKVLDGFRKLDVQSQQTAIAKLFGTGRIGTLVNKLIQDSSNAVLERNLRSAEKGSEGNSALKEQETVLKTLDAQLKAAKNSLYKLAVDSAEEMLGPLTQYIAQLNQALQSPGLKSFVASIMKSVMQVISFLAEAAKLIASLNINWENFVGVAKVFLGLKLAELFGGKLLAGTTAWGDSLRYVLTGMTAAQAAEAKLAGEQAASGAAAQAAATNFKSSVASRLLGYEELSKAAAARRAALAAEKAAEADVAAARATAAAARASNAVTQGRSTAANSQLNAAAGAAQAARQQLQAAEAAAATARAQQAQALNARIQQQETAHTARLLEIEQAFQARKAEIKATGTTVGLTAAKREYAQQQADETASHERSLRGIQSYYARRLATVEAGQAANIAAARAGLMTQLAAFDGALANQAAKGVNVAAGAAQVAAADAALVSATSKLTAAQKAAQAATATMTAFGTVMRTVGSIVATAGRLIMSGFLWITVIYSLLDATVGAENLGKAFQWLTDKIGLTSEKQRVAAVETQAQTEKLAQQRKEIEELIKKYDELGLVQNGTGQLDRTKGNAFDSAVAKLQAASDTGERVQAIAELDQQVQVIEAKIEVARAKVQDGNKKLVDAATADIAAAAAKVAELRAQLLNPPQQFDPLGFPMGTVDTTSIQAQIDALTQKIEASRKAIDDTNKSTEVYKSEIVGLEQAARTVAEAVAGIFTPDTLKYAQDNLQAYAENSVQLVDLQEKASSLSALMKTGNTEAAAAYDIVTNQIKVLRAEQDATKKAVEEYIATQLAMPGVPDSVKASWEALRALIASTGKLAGNAIGYAIENPQAANGKNAQNPKPKTSGTGSYSGKSDKSAENEAKKLARARLELERATIQAENNLKEEQSKQQLDADTRLYDRGLQAMADYYDKRRTIQLQANQFDIDDKNREIAAIDKEIADAKTESEKVKFQVQAQRLKGQIAVLQEQRKAIDAQNTEEARRAAEQFSDRIIEETNRLASGGYITRPIADDFKQNLAQMENQYREFLNRLRAEGKTGLADQLQKAFQTQALDAAIQTQGQGISQAFDAIGRYQNRLNLARNEGLLTSQQAEAAYTKTLQQQIPALQQLLALQEAQLEQFRAIGDTASPAYQRIADSVDSTRLRIQQLNSEMNKTAKEINQGITDALSNALGNLEPTLGGIREAFKNFIINVAKQLQQQFAKNISEMIMQSLNSSGSGGIGGFFQSILQMTGRGGAPNKDAVAGAAAKGIQLGATPATAMYVRSADGALEGLLGGQDKAADAGGLDSASGIEGVTAKLTESLNGTFDSLSTTLSGVMSNLGSMLTGLFNNLGSTLSSLFNSLSSALSSMGSSSSGGGGNWLSSLFSLFFHTGGVVGRGGRPGRVNPLLFAGALRYHGGGIAGLKPDEVPAILQKGEEVLTANDERHRDNGGLDSPGGGGTRILNILDPDLAKNYMESAAGEKVILNHIRNNAGAVSGMLK